MRIEIRAKDFTLTEGIRLHVERRLGFALDRFTQKVRAVLVSVSDVNGPKGGNDKSCRMTVQLSHGGVVLEERAGDLYVAIDRAAHRVSMKTARELNRFHRPASFDLRWRSREGEVYEGTS